MRCQGVSLQPLRPYSLHLAIIWRGEWFQHFSDISRLLTFMMKFPQTCLSSNSQCADTLVYELHTYTDVCQRCGFVLNDCKHTWVWNYVLLSSIICEIVHRANVHECIFFCMTESFHCRFFYTKFSCYISFLHYSVLANKVYRDFNVQSKQFCILQPSSLTCCFCYSNK